MSPRNSSKKPPVASRRKRAIHALYLVQPLLQFAALMIVMFALARCSPLAPSTDKSVLKASANGLVSPHSDQAQKGAEEEDIKREMKDLSSFDDLRLISQSDFAARVVPNSIEAEKGADLTGVQNVFRQRAKLLGTSRGVRLLIVRLLKDQKDSFFKTGSLRLNLADVLANSMAPDVRKAFFTELHKISANDLKAKAYLILSDDDMASPEAVTEVPLAGKFQMAILPNDEKAWLQLSRTDLNLDDQQQKLIESNKEKSIAMAIVLE
ncbi:MAG: hypothetical protein ACXVB9_17060 [Bdellovibrionota bacterium]